MTPAPQRVSVIVPTRDRDALLDQALASIRALEGPDLTFEILVGDNGLSEATRAVAEAHGAVYIPVQVKGCAAARNACFARATGTFTAFLDDDDVWLEGHVRPHLALMAARPDVPIVIGQTITADHDLKPTYGPWPTDLPSVGDIFPRLLAGLFPQVGATVFRTSLREEFGLFDETLLGDNDWDWQMRVTRVRPCGFVATPCCLFRQRAEGTFDDLQRLRVGYTRRIFLRHAQKSWRRWSSPVTFARTYFSSVELYYQHFSARIRALAEAGDRRAALRCLWTAFTINPVRTVRLLLRRSELTGAMRRLLAPTSTVRV
jgi:glycosyltransferase involved in cell wall biosynthesis